MSLEDLNPLSCGLFDRPSHERSFPDTSLATEQHQPTVSCERRSELSPQGGLLPHPTGQVVLRIGSGCTDRLGGLVHDSPR
jgi:hypothetical protein